MATNLVIDAKLSKWTYSTSLNNSSAPLNIDGWQPVKVTQFIQTSANFAAQLFVGSDGTYKVAYRGTASLLSSGDTTMNGQSIVLNRWTQELTDSVNFTHAAIRYIADTKGIDYDKARALLSVTGHSQGGFESEVNAKFFGLKGTSLDGPGASAITQTQGFVNRKKELQAGEPQLQSDYPIGDFVARRYTFIVGALNNHVDGIVTDNSVLSLTSAALTTLANPLVGIGVQAQFLHSIDNIIDMETARASSNFWQIFGFNGATDSIVAQVGGYMYPTNVASADGSVPMVTPDPAVMNQITNFLANEAGLGATIHVRNGATYIESNGASLLIRGDGSGERWITSGNTVTQEILGKDSIVTNRVETRFVDNQTVTDTSRYNPLSTGLVLEKRIVQTANSDGTVTREVFKGADELVVTSTAEQLGDGSILFTDVYPDGNVITRVEDALLETSSQSGNGSQTLANAITTYGPNLIDALSLLKAIQSGDPLPIAVSGLRLANDISNLADLPNYNLSGAASVGGSILSILSLQQALQRGDTLAAVTAGAQALSFGATAYAEFAAESALTASIEEAAAAQLAYNEAQALSSTIGEALPYLNLVNAIAQGDEVGVAVAAISIAYPPIGIAYAVYNIISSLFGDDDPPPEPWGNAWAGWSGFTAVTNANGGDGGQGTAAETYNGFISYLNQLAAYEQSVNPGSAIGIVANRLPSITYRNYTGFQLTDIDPLTGVQRSPEIKYDLTGRPYNAPAGSDQASQSLSERFIRVALARGAVAPMWEVQTAAIQTQYGDPQAGLTEEERAGRNGLLAPSPQRSPASGGGSQVFRAVALDLNGDGVQTTGSNKTVAFDVDDSGYLKNTAWLNNNDGFLFLDRNLNGSIDSGRELFSNSIVDLSARGLAGMRWIDANYDGKLTSADPVWNELKVWQDGDGDGQADAGEVKGLAALGITALDYAMGRFEQNGQLKEMSSPDLAADTAGTRTHVIPEGIVVETSSGHTSLLVTRIDDETVIEANRDGITSYEDIETIVSTADLMANDVLGGFVGQNLTVTGVSDFTHGTGWLDGNGFVHYNPAANYYGAASFNYTIQAPTGQTATATVDINLQNVNDAPTATIDQHLQPIYGYQTSYDWESGASTQTPYYQPYSGWDDTTGWGYHNTPIAYYDPDGPNVATVVASDIDDPSGPFAYQVIAQPQMGSASIDANGNIQYTNWYGPNTPGAAPDGSTYNIGSNDSGYGAYTDTYSTQPDPFTVRVTDPHGASTTIQVDSVHTGAYNPSLGSGGGGGGCCPVSIDLDRNGFGFSNVDDSNVFFDINGDGWKEKVSWVSPGDGLLAYDADGNGKIESGAEVSFAAYKAGAQSDLEGMRAFDSNNDGIFSASDEKWSKFGIWQDANQNGVTDPGEFKSLDALGVDSINLTSDNRFSVINGTTVQGVAKVTMTDGSTLDAADFTLRYTNDILVNNPDGTIQVVTRPPFSPSGEVLNGTDSNDLILGKTGNNIITAGAGDDVVMEDGGNDFIDGGAGNDTIYSGADNDLVIAGAGDDVVFAGLGNDMVLDGDGNDVLFGEGGNDVIFGGKGNDLISGDSGNDVLSGDAGDDQVYGGSGNDAVFGGAGNDELAGMDGYDRLDGGTGNDLLDGGAGADEMIGGTGDDIYAVDNVGDIVTENPAEGIDTVRSSISYTLGANLENLTLTGTENLTGTGNDADNVLIGNSGDNTLTAGAGNDTLDGGMGADTLTGGTGDDVYVVDNAADIVFERPNEGTDSVLSSVSYTLTDNVENLVLTGRSAIDGGGNALDNVITGNIAGNVLDGGAGADTLTGGRGNDTYVVDNTGDRTIELVNEGVDTVVSSLSWTLAENIENLALTGTDDLNGTGNGLDNVLAGNAGNNRIDGGLGADTMAGGAGDDTYIVDNTADRLIEAANEGNDSIFASVSYTLSANVENLTLTGTANIDGRGNELDNVIAGNSGNNILDGGAGADTLTGGAGNDTYVVDNAGDTVAELANEGIDAVQSFIDYTLGANVENLTLTGMADLTGTGNELDNVIAGNDGNNVLLGADGNDTLTGNGGNDILDGGAGADVMTGGAGDDTYIVDNIADSVAESVGEGADSVLASVSYTLAANVDNLTLTGTAATDASGNELDNVITGNDGNNVLLGAAGNDILTGNGGNDILDGGTGADVMAGGTGDDVYVVESVGDLVVEQFNAGIDDVYSSIGYVLPENVENLTLTGTDGIDGIGNGLDNVIVGNGTANLLDGGAGADTLAGGAGDDTYIVDNTADVVIEAANEGKDSVFASASYILSDNVENLFLTGTANINGSGNVLDNVIVGNAGNNVLLGAAGSDMLFGGGGNDLLDGGTGADAMAGGAGDDTYMVGDVGDAVTELASEGIDTVYSSIDYTLGDYVENLTLTGTDNLSGTGNELDNAILGNAGNNLIDGAAGADSMAGGLGDDAYIVDNAGDLIVEQFNEGLDHVYSSISYVLPQHVENLTLTGFDAINGAGNDLDNFIVGNAANNVLDGAAGADTLNGGAGDDTYIVDNAGDRTVELAGEGIDTVYSSVSWTLAGNVENLTLTGTDAIDGSGNELDNILIGNGADNRLIGNEGKDSLFGNAGNDILDGGADNDALDGGSGDDTYIWRKGDGLDTIADAGGNDTVRFGDALNLDNLALRVTSENGIHTAHVRALNDGGCEMGDQGFDFTVGVDANGGYVSPIEQFRLADGARLTFDDLLIKTAVTLVRPGREDDHNEGKGRKDSGKDDHDSGFGTDKHEENDSRLKQIRLTDGSRLRWDNLPSGTLVATVNPKNRTVATGRNDDIILGSANTETIRAGTGNDIVFASAGKDTLYGEGGNDALLGGKGADTLIGGCGYDILAGGEGKDNLIAGDENNLLLGGKGDDRILAGAGNDFIAGGQGDDTIVTGAGDNTVAFNREDGRDTILASAGARNTLSLGEDLEYRDLGFMRSGNDLVLEARHRDAITFKDWYASPDNRTFFTLQTIEEKSDDWDDSHLSSDKYAFVTHPMINEAGSDTFYDRKVERFDFQKLADSFDQARAANPNLAKWNLMNGLLDAHLGGSDNAALGGEFAYEYGQSGSLAQAGISAAQTALKDPGFGGLQTLKPFQGLAAEIAIGR